MSGRLSMRVMFTCLAVILVLLVIPSAVHSKVKSAVREENLVTSQLTKTEEEKDFILTPQTAVSPTQGGDHKKEEEEEEEEEEKRLWYLRKQATHEVASFSATKVHVLRLSPGEDLLLSLFRYADVMGIKASTLVSVVGSLQQTNIRYANDSFGTDLSGHFEIVSCVGNIDSQLEKTSAGGYGSGHVHIALSNEVGETIGGHLLTGNLVYTTAEITLLEMTEGLFLRRPDDAPEGSGYRELKVYKYND